MFYTLKKIAFVFKLLSIASIILSIITGYVLWASGPHYETGIVLTYFWICSLFIPASLIGVAVTLEKIADELNDESFHIRERLKKLEDR